MSGYGFDFHKFDIDKFDSTARTHQISEQELGELEETYHKVAQKLADDGIQLTEETINVIHKALADNIGIDDENIVREVKKILRDNASVTEEFDIRKGQFQAYTFVGVEGLRIFQRNLRISDTTNNRVSTCSFTVEDPSDAVINACKMRANILVTMVDGGKTHYFGGRIIQNPLAGNGPLRKLFIEAEDFTAEAADFLVTGSYEGTVTEVLTELWGTFYEKPFRMEIAQSNEQISVDFNYETLFDATEYIVEQVGWLWFIDFDGAERVLRIFPPESEIYEREISEKDLNPLADTPNFSYDDELINAIYLFGGEGISEEISQTEVADGEKTIYYTYYKPVDLKLYVDGVQKSVGIKNIHNFDEYDVLMNYNEKTIEFPEDDKPPAGAKIRYEYKYRYPIVVYMEDAESIAEYGKVVKRIDDPKITTPEQARKVAEKLLREKSHPKLGGTLTVMDAGIRAGMYIRVNLPKYGVKGVFRVNQAEKYIQNNMIFNRLDLNRITRSTERFVAKMKELANRIGNLEAKERDDTVVQRFNNVGENLSIVDSHEIKIDRAGVSAFGDARWDFGTFA